MVGVRIARGSPGLGLGRVLVVVVVELGRVDLDLGGIERGSPKLELGRVLVVVVVEVDRIDQHDWSDNFCLPLVLHHLRPSNVRFGQGLSLAPSAI